MPFLLVKLLRICNNFLEFNCLQFCVLFKSVFFKDSFGSRRWLSTRWKSWFFPSSVKKKNKTKSKTRKKKRITQSLLSCKKIICVKSPVLSFTQSVSQSVSKTDYQSIFRLAAKLGTHIASQWNSQSVVLVIGQHSFSQLVK